MDILSVIIQILLGFGVVLVLLVFTAPFYARFFSSDVKNPSKLHAFTTCAPNEAKAVMRGETFIRLIMNSPTHFFAGRNAIAAEVDAEDGSTDWKGLWEVHKGASNEWERAGIVPSNTHGNGYSPSLLNWFKLYVYNWSGYIFTGVPGWQFVYTYPLPRTEMIRDKDGGQHVELKNDVSDRVIILDDTWFLKMDGLETADSIPMDVVLSLQVRITNPYLALFGNEKWYEVLDSSMRSHLIDIFKSYTSEKFIGGLKFENEVDFKNLFKEPESSNNEGTLKEINDKLRNVVDKLSGSKQQNGDSADFGLRDRYGIEIAVVQLLDVDPPKLLAETLYKPVEARRRGLATIIDGVAKSKALEEIVKVIEAGGETGRLVQQYEAQIATANASQNVFLTGGASGSVGENALLLQQLQELGVTMKELRDSLGSQKGDNSK